MSTLFSCACSVLWSLQTQDQSFVYGGRWRRGMNHVRRHAGRHLLEQQDWDADLSCECRQSGLQQQRPGEKSQISLVKPALKHMNFNEGLTFFSSLSKLFLSILCLCTAAERLSNKRCGRCSFKVCLPSFFSSFVQFKSLFKLQQLNISFDNLSIACFLY